MWCRCTGDDEWKIKGFSNLIVFQFLFIIIIKVKQILASYKVRKKKL